MKSCPFLIAKITPYIQGKLDVTSNDPKHWKMLKPEEIIICNRRLDARYSELGLNFYHVPRELEGTYNHVTRSSVYMLM